MSDDPRITIDLNRLRFGTYSWQGQAPQYDQLGPPNEIVYRIFEKGYVNALLSYDENGQLVGILNHYPHDVVSGGTVLEKAGNVNTFVRPDATPAVHQRLLRECMRRWHVTEDTEVEFCVGASGQRWSVRDLLEDGNRRITRLRSLNR